MKLIISSVVVLLLLLLELDHSPLNANKLPYSNIPDTLVVLLRNNQSDYYLYCGELSGFQTDMVHNFARVLRKPCRIEIEPDATQRYHKICSGYAHFTVGNNDDDSLRTTFDHDFLISLPLENTTSSVWILHPNHLQLLTNINIWITQYRRTREYATKLRTYFMVRANLPVKARHDSLSPYDYLIKRYAPYVGWDWRLLASMIYQESRFVQDACSRTGAYGLMQVMPGTAAHFKVENIEDPEYNIIAGTRFIRYLQKSVNVWDSSEEDRIRFILAAYNAGYGRIIDCRKFTASQGKNPDVWNDVASVIPLMKHEIFYNNNNILRYGRFIGKETLAYVSQIMNRFEHYKVLVEE